LGIGILERLGSASIRQKYLFALIAVSPYSPAADSKLDS
jgi:hypothetical protein